MKLKRHRTTIYEKLFAVLVLFMPLHTMLFDHMIPSQIDNLWRDFLLVVLVIVLFIGRRHSKFNVGKYGKYVCLMWVICLLYTIISDRLLVSLNLARTYLIPTLIYFVILNIRTDNTYLDRIEKIFIYEAVILSIFGIFQAFILGDSFLISLGYSSSGGHLASSSFYISGYYGIQRVTSTFTSPNICGAFLGMAVILLSKRTRKFKHSIMMMAVLLIGLITTFSRSALIGTIFALFLSHWEKTKTIKLSKKVLIVIPIVTCVALSIDYIALDGLVMNMLSSNILSAINVTDASAVKHISDLFEPLGIVISHPFGLGFGHNGPIVYASFSDANLVESSVYLLAYNFGIFGAIVFLLPLLKEFVKMIKGKVFSETSGAVCTMILITYLLLPNIETYEIIFFVYLFIGMAEKRTNLMDSIGMTVRNSKIVDNKA